MSCESCTGCFSVAPCSAPSPLRDGHMSKEYRQFLKAARACMVHVERHDTVVAQEKLDQQRHASQQQDHAFNSIIGILANGQFATQTSLAQAYKQLGPSAFLALARSLAHHGFWGRLITWAWLLVNEDGAELQRRIDGRDQALVQGVSDEAEVFEVFNPGVQCQRPAWNPQPMPDI